MAYIVTRNKKSGYVALVEKKRVRVAGNKTSVRNVGYVCGLGVMTQSEFEEFRDWAHGITHQESRKEAVLACPRVVKKIKETKAVIAGEQQKETTVKRAKRVKVIKDKYTPEEREEERKRFRTEYEEKKGITVKKTTKRVSNGIRFTGRKSIGEKRRILNERITELNHRIANAKTDIIVWQKGKAKGMKIAESKQLVSEYQSILKTLKKQRSELRK